MKKKIEIVFSGITPLGETPKLETQKLEDMLFGKVEQEAILI